MGVIRNTRASRSSLTRTDVIVNDNFSWAARRACSTTLRCVPARKEKSQIARALRPGSDGIVQPGGDRQFGDPWNRTGGIFSRDAFQNPALGDGKHHDAGGNSFARRIPSGEFQGVTN